MDEAVRQALASAKAEIEKMSGVKFSRESLALADLISQFVAIKALNVVGGTKPTAVIGTVDSGASPTDALYRF